jgi:F-type H+-transporting ATPase subunit a
MRARLEKMSVRRKALLGVGLYVLIAILIGIVFGTAAPEPFLPQDEFLLEPWIPIVIGPVDLSITKAVLYLFLACGATIGAMLYVANRMAARPNRVQTAVETIYDFTRNTITRGNMDEKMAARWFAVTSTLFLFILLSNLIGYIPLPINTLHPLVIFGVEIPSLALYAATANLSIPLVLTLVVWFSYHAEGIRHKGFVPYFKGWVPSGVTGVAAIPIFGIEVISHFVRLISLSVRLFANVLAGHLLILFMGGGLAVLLGIAVLGWVTLPAAIAFFVFEIVLIAGLQAFIFANLTSIYLGEATGEGH